MSVTEDKAALIVRKPAAAGVETPFMRFRSDFTDSWVATARSEEHTSELQSH